MPIATETALFVAKEGSLMPIATEMSLFVANEGSLMPIATETALFVANEGSLMPIYTETALSVANEDSLMPIATETALFVANKTYPHQSSGAESCRRRSLLLGNRWIDREYSPPWRRVESDAQNATARCPVGPITLTQRILSAGVWPNNIRGDIENSNSLFGQSLWQSRL